MNPVRIKDLSEALGLFRQLKDTIHAILAENSIFDVYFVQGKIDTVAQELARNMELERAIGFRELHYNYTVIAYIENMMGRNAEALQHSTESIKIMEAQQDTAFATYFYLKMGNLIAYYGNLEETLLWYDKVMKAPRDKQDRYWYPAFLSEAMSLQLLGRYKELWNLINTTTKDYPPNNPLDALQIDITMGTSYSDNGYLAKAQPYFDSAAIFAEQLRDVPEAAYYITTYLSANALQRIRLGDVAGAKNFLQRSRLQMNGMQGTVPLRSNNFMIQYKIDSATGDMTAALANYKQMRWLDDTVFTARKTRQLEEFKVKFDIAQKDKDLQLLQNKSQLQQDELEREATTRTMIIIGLVMLSLLLGLLYNRFRLKQRQQKEINHKNQVLEKLVDEKDELLTEKDTLINDKEWLIKEIHHRVKNNLQMVVSLLSAQSAHLRNKEALHAIRESEQRMHAMSLIHQKLYQTDKMELIEMSAYIRELTGYLNAHTGRDVRVRFVLELQPVKLDVAQAVPLGLILNEAITNAIKYAFTDIQTGTISIRLRHIYGQMLELRIADNGHGLPAGLDMDKITSLGITLMRGLSVQLKGTMTIVDEQGVTITIQFPYNLFAMMENEMNASLVLTNE